MNEYEIDGSISDREEDHLIPLQFEGELTGTELKRVPSERLEGSEVKIFQRAPLSLSFANYTHVTSRGMSMTKKVGDP